MTPPGPDWSHRPRTRGPGQEWDALRPNTATVSSSPSTRTRRKRHRRNLDCKRTHRIPTALRPFPHVNRDQPDTWERRGHAVVDRVGNPRWHRADKKTRAPSKAKSLQHVKVNPDVPRVPAYINRFCRFAAGGQESTPRAPQMVAMSAMGLSDRLDAGSDGVQWASVRHGGRVAGWVEGNRRESLLRDASYHVCPSCCLRLIATMNSPLNRAHDRK